MEEFIGKINSSKKLKAFVRTADLLLTLSVYIAFPVMLAVIFASNRTLALSVAVCAAVPFLAVSVLRRIINAKRPFEVYGFTSPIQGGRHGNSFPSRHVFSSALIASFALRFIPPLGVALFFVTAAIAVLRVICGVHFIRDVVAGAALGIIFASIGIWVIILVF